MVLRKIPFTPMVKKVLPYIDFDRAKNTNLNTISTRMKRLLPERTRTNFGTRSHCRYDPFHGRAAGLDPCFPDSH